MEKELTILNENPPFIDELRNIFRLPEGAIMTVGSILYNPSSRPIDEPLMAHETLHSEQQGNDSQGWWRRYILDKDFRLSQEIPAYTVQVKSAKKFIKDRNALHRYIVQLAKDLSGEQYGSMMTFFEALEVIKREKLIDFET